MSKIPFRVSDGLDGADQRAINIGYPDITVKTDGVNIQYFIDENTVQQYDEKRKYKKNFAVLFNDRLYYAKRDVPVDNSATAGVFNETHWQQLRTDPNWTNVNSTIATGQQLTVGMFVSADPSYSDLNFILPRGAQDGDTVVIKDVSSKVSTMKLIVRTTDKVLDNGKAEYQLTYPKATMWITYDASMDLGKGGWRINTTNPKLEEKTVSPTQQGTQLSNGETVFRRSSAGKITMVLPLYANEGDTIQTVDLDGATAVNNLTVKTHPSATSSVGKVGQKSVISKTTGWGYLIFNAAQNLWEIFDGDEYERWTKVVPTTPASNLSVIPNSRILIAGKSGSINFTLPAAPAAGDSVKFSLRNASKGVSLSIKASGGDKIHATPEMLGIPRIDEVQDYDSVTPILELKYTALGRGEQIKFVYVDTEKAWSIAEQGALDFRASANAASRSELGLTSYATDAEVMKDSEQNPSDEQAVTPLSLSRKTATPDRRGIAKLANQTEVNAGVVTDKIVTPKTLNDRTALETRTGIAAIATQAEANADAASANDTKFITPKKLANRTATDTRSGVLMLMPLAGTKQPARNQPGTAINNFNENTRAITAKSLFEKTATETNLGMSFWATQAEVNAGTDDNIVVRPSTLQARTATATRTGLARMVDRATNEHKQTAAASIDDNVFITPKALAERVSTYDMDGITRAAKNEHITAGTEQYMYVNPSKLRYFAETVVKTSAPDADGLSVTGNAWAGLVFRMSAATETARGTLRIATQSETDTGSLDNVMLTPRKLNSRTATTGRTGIIRLATPAEAAAGTLDNVAITPSTMGSVITDSPEWGSTEARRGSAYTAGLTNDASANTVWQGDDIKGSTRTLVNYKHDSYAVSPRGLNTALSHYLPIKAQAVDSNQLGGLTSDKYMRTDKDTSTTGGLSAKGRIFSNTLLGTEGQLQLPPARGSYIGWNKESGVGKTDFLNHRGTGDGGFAWWKGTETNVAKIMDLNGSGQLTVDRVSAATMVTTGSIGIGGEITYKGQTLDARFVRSVGDTMTGDLNFNGASGIKFADNGKVDGSINVMIEGTCGANDYGYIAVGATATDSGFLEIGTRDGGNEPIYVRQRSGAANTITRTLTLLDAAGNTGFPGIVVIANKMRLNSGPADVYMHNTSANTYLQLKDNGKLTFSDKEVYHEGHIPTPAEVKAVNLAGDTMTGSLTVKQDVIVEGNFKIKVGNKYLVIRPNAANETVSFDWE